MVKYENKEMILDVIKNTGVMVLDANAQGIFELDAIGRRLLTEFPEVAMQYKAACSQGMVSPGDVLHIESFGYEFIFLVNTYYRVGSTLKDVDAAVVNSTIKCIKKLKEKLPNKNYISGILSRHANIWQQVAGHIAAADLNWTVYRE